MGEIIPEVFDLLVPLNAFCMDLLLRISLFLSTKTTDIQI